MAYDVDEAVSTSSTKAPSMEKERNWWSADLEGAMEKLKVVGSFCVTATDGGFIKCEVEEQQAARVEVQGAISQEEAAEIGFVQSALSESRGV